MSEIRRIGSSTSLASSLLPDQTGASAQKAQDLPVSSSRRLPRVDWSHVDPKVREAAQGMESIFLDYLMKVMRETVPKNDLDLESPATGIYRSMMDTEVAQKAAQRGGIGLAEQIVAYLESNRYANRGGVSRNVPLTQPTKEKP